MGRTSPATRAQRSGRSVADLIQGRQEAVALMTPALKRKFHQIERSLQDERAKTLRYYYNLGKICEDIQDHPETYEPRALRLLGQALCTQDRTLRKALNFVRAYSDEELEELINLVNPDTGFFLHWGHLSYLLIVKQKGKRWMWAKKAVNRVWPPDELHRKLKEHYGAQVPTPHGRHATLPSTIPGQIRQVRDDTEKWLTKQRTAWNGDKINAFGNMLTASPDTWTQDMIDDLKVARAAMEGVVSEARENIARIDRIIRRAETCLEETLQQRAEAEAEAVHVGKAARVIDLNTPARFKRKG